MSPRIERNDSILIDIGEIRVAIDPRSKTPCLISDLVLVSHAHWDHCSGVRSLRNWKRVLCSPETSKIIGKRFWEMEELGRIEIDHIEIRALGAGHVLGSLQFLLELDGSRILYTGDLKLEDDIVVRGARAIDSDILILESTYGSPEFRFPDRDDIYSDIDSWATMSIRRYGKAVFVCGSLGKAQELSLLFNNMKVFVDESIRRINDALSSLGSFPRIEYTSFWDSEIVLISRKLPKNTPGIGDFPRALVTGFSLKMSGGVWNSKSFDAFFPLSSHADFEDLIWFVDACNPRIVYTHHGLELSLAREIESILGIPARPLGRSRYRILDEFLGS